MTKAQLTEIETYFRESGYPDGPVQISPAETVTDVKKMVESHLIIVKDKRNRRGFAMYEKRLLTIYEKVKESRP